MTHIAEDIRFLLVIGGGGALAALGVCRVKYSEDWLDPWLIIVKALFALALIVIGVNEHEFVHAWWSAAPVSTSLGSVSTVAWLLALWNRRSKSRTALLDLELHGEPKPTNVAIFPAKLVYWGAGSLLILLLSLVIAMLRLGRGQP
jgi:hypothetical protein